MADFVTKVEFLQNLTLNAARRYGRFTGEAVALVATAQKFGEEALSALQEQFYDGYREAVGEAAEAAEEKGLDDLAEELSDALEYTLPADRPGSAFAEPPKEPPKEEEPEYVDALLRGEEEAFAKLREQIDLEMQMLRNPG